MCDVIRVEVMEAEKVTEAEVVRIMNSYTVHPIVLLTVTSNFNLN